jgi:nucleoside-diphosphate-sugar epimerase
MSGVLREKGYGVVGLDSAYFRGSEFITMPPVNRQILKDLRDVEEKDLEGIDSVIHLSGLSNDPLGELNKDLTVRINSTASCKLAELAKKSGVRRFLFSSSCSVYGIAQNDIPLTELGTLNPVTEYAKSKAFVEENLFAMADSGFHPTCLRNATVYGFSPSLRLDLVVNNLTAWGYLTGKIAIMSDGTPWRPIVHVRDLVAAFLAVLEGPSEKVHNQCFNVGRNEENYQVKDIAEIVHQVVPNCRVEILNTTSSDERTYRVDFSKFAKTFPNSGLKWTVRDGVQELYSAFRDFGLKKEDLDDKKYFRVRWIKYLLESKNLNSDLLWTI